ncbi:uncharacterized protein LOC128514914 [Clarias gariepinus]|uniref:uncharacterized protein LOC128514914 n=1 Tax=Clarias gariepinus TaxID=13013 RepID=UPI00234D2752|nr:uncharacterized protein LOC128514914 [Clarias gariepinus]
MAKKGTYGVYGHGHTSAKCRTLRRPDRLMTMFALLPPPQKDPGIDSTSADHLHASKAERAMVTGDGKTSDMKNLHVKIVKLGEDVIMQCDINGLKNKNTFAWYRQSFGNVPQVFARQFGQNSYIFAEGFNNSRFSVTVNYHMFNLNIIKIREDDGGEYFCGYVDGSTVKFTSGICLQFEGEEMKPCPTPGTLNKNTHSVTHQGSNSRDEEGSSSNNHQTPTNQADDENVLNYAAVSFAKKPSSSRTSRDTSHQDVYAQVKIK